MNNDYSLQPFQNYNINIYNLNINCVNIYYPPVCYPFYSFSQEDNQSIKDNYFFLVRKNWLENYL